MLKILEKAKAAGQQENWLLAIHYLQQLPWECKGQSGLEEEQQEILDVALMVLHWGDFQERWEVAKILPQLGELTIAPLTAILADEEAETEERWFAGRILGEMKHPQAIATLVGCAQNTKDEELTAIIATALANLGAPAIEALTILLQVPSTRLLAVRALAQIRNQGVIPPLLEIVEDEEPKVRSLALAALNSFHDDRTLPILLKALNDYSAAVRKEAVIGLGLRSDLASSLNLVDHLKPRLYDLNLEVCQQAAMALGRIKTPTAAETLYEVLLYPTTPLPLQIDLIHALGWMEIPQSLFYLERAFTLVPEDGILEIIRILGRIKSVSLKTKAAEILLQFYHSDHPSLATTAVKQALAQAWGLLREPRTVDVLVQWMGDANNSVKLHAIAALKYFHLPQVNYI